MFSSTINQSHKQNLGASQVTSTMQTKRQATKLQRGWLQDVSNNSPHRIHQQNDYAGRVGDAAALREGVSEPARCTDVFLKQVASDDETYCKADQAAPQGISDQARSHHDEKNHRARHF